MNRIIKVITTRVKRLYYKISVVIIILRESIFYIGFFNYDIVQII